MKIPFWNGPKTWKTQKFGEPSLLAIKTRYVKCQEGLFRPPIYNILVLSF